MQDKKEYKQQIDDFSNLIKQKLDNHRLPVDEDCWGAIEAQLQPKKRYLLRWVSAAASIAAAIALIIFFIPSNDNSSYIAVIQQNINPITTEDLFKAEINLSENKQAQNAPIRSSQIIRKQQPKLIAVDNNTNKENNKEEIPAIVNKPETDNVAENTPVQPESDQETIKKDSSSTPKNSKKIIDKYELDKIFIAEVERKDDKWLLAASVSSSGNLSLRGDLLNSVYNNPSSEAYDRNPSLSHKPLYDYENNIKEMIPPDEYTDTKHSIPLSFGLTVRKDFNKYWGIETGLVYTYLSSKFEKFGGASYQAKQELHYLGIPANVVVYLWNTPKWNVYISGGGMLEKGLHYKYVQNMTQGRNLDSSISNKGSVSGVQWSLNASAGISYSFIDNWSVYFEPRFSYYFDNNQPASIRTEKPNVFGLGAGFRYEF